MTESGHAILSLDCYFQSASKALWTEYELGPAELTREDTIYEMRAEAFLLWRTNLRTAALLPNEFHSVGLMLPLPRDAHATATI
jgi:hypothetical protein